MDIVEDDLSRPEVLALLDEHLEGMYSTSPPESVHALDIDGLRAADVSFWTIWEGDEVLGCGALKELDPAHGEIKSMRTASGQVRRGIGSAMLEHLVTVARQRGYTTLSLETGTGPAFEASHALYRKFGFRSCGPFANYREDPFSNFMTLIL